MKKLKTVRKKIIKKLNKAGRWLNGSAKYHVQKLKKMPFYFKVATIYLLAVASMTAFFFWRVGKYYPEVPLGREEISDEFYENIKEVEKEEDIQSAPTGGFENDAETEGGEQHEEEVTLNAPVWPVDVNKVNRETMVKHGSHLRHKTRSGEMIVSHMGLGLPVPENTEVVAAWDGRVKEIRYGDLVFVKVIVIEHAEGVFSLYGNFSTFHVKPGETVTQGTPIGRVGNESKELGVAGVLIHGPYLHFEMFEIESGKKAYMDPLDYLPKY